MIESPLKLLLLSAMQVFLTTLSNLHIACLLFHWLVRPKVFEEHSCQLQAKENSISFSLKIRKKYLNTLLSKFSSWIVGYLARWYVVRLIQRGIVSLYCRSLVTADYYNAPMLYTNSAPYPNIAAPAQNPYQGEDTYQRESAVDSEPRPNWPRTHFSNDIVVYTTGLQIQNC